MFATGVTRGRLHLAAILCASLVLSCGKDEKSTEPILHYSERLPQSSPANVLTELRTAYVDRDVDRYEKLFAPEFIFYFEHADVTNPNNPTPSSWGLSDECQSERHLFASSSVERTELSFVQDAAEPATGEMEGTSKVVVREIYLRVDIRMPDGSPLQQVVNSGLAEFYFKEYPGEAATDGAPIVRIVRWDDLGFGSLFRSRAEQSTWGAIKAYYWHD